MSYLGYIISKDGLRASDERVQAILQYATPTDLNQLESFVGKLNYYGKFLPAFASVCAPLNQLWCKDTPWKWSTECAVAFVQLKQMLADKTRLVHFDPEKPIVLATDASPYGIGAVISHVLPDGSEEPIAFVSKTLSKAERGYAQVEKEGLSIVYVRYPEVQPIPKWSTFHHPDRPQATPNDLRTVYVAPSHVFTAPTALGSAADGPRL